MSSKSMIFGIGLSRTATTSLDAALWHLGLRSVHYPSADRMVARDWSVLDGYDAATDTPVAAFYKELDAAFPGSRFILTVRDARAWLPSVARLFARSPERNKRGAPGEIRRRVYGTVEFEPGAFIEAYRRHLIEVGEYFRGRPDDLLVMDITAGDGWEKLCPFLGRPRPDFPFPQVNGTKPKPGAVGYPEEARRARGPITFSIGGRVA